MKIIPRDDDGKFLKDSLPKSFNPVYGESLIKYLNCIDPLFQRAQEADEFQFVLTLLRNRGVQDAGWDPYENSVHTIDAVMDLEKKLQGDVKGNIFLWVYGHIVEASEPYETIANLLNIVLGDSYRAWNFPKKKVWWGYRNQYPLEKIKYLEELAKKAKMPEVIEPIKDVLDKDLRNAVFHSDYSFYDGEVRLNDPSKVYSQEETLALTNKALAYHETIKNVIEAYRIEYTESKIINVSESFSKDPDERAVLIIRKEHGVTGMRDNWTEEETKLGKIPWFIGRYLPYEKEYLDKKEVVLPVNKIEKWNKLLRRLPKFLSKPMKQIVEKHLL